MAALPLLKRPLRTYSSHAQTPPSLRPQLATSRQWCVVRLRERASAHFPVTSVHFPLRSFWSCENPHPCHFLSPSPHPQYNGPPNTCPVAVGTTPSQLTALPTGCVTIGKISFFYSCTSTGLAATSYSQAGCVGEGQAAPVPSNLPPLGCTPAAPGAASGGPTVVTCVTPSGAASVALAAVPLLLLALAVVGLGA